MPEIKEWPASGPVVIGPPRLASLVAKVADENGCDYILDANCPPGSVYSHPDISYVTSPQQTQLDRPDPPAQI